MATGIADITGVAESGQTDKYKKVFDDILTNTMPIGGKDASIVISRPRQVAAQDITSLAASMAESSVKSTSQLNSIIKIVKSYRTETVFHSRQRAV